MVGGQAAAPEAVEEDRDPERLGQRPQLLLAAAPVEAGAGHDRRPLRSGQQRRRLLRPGRRFGLLDLLRQRGMSTSASVKTTSSG